MTLRTPARRPPSLGGARPAFSLLEVILALAILAGATAVLGEVMWQANRRAVAARAESQAQLLAQNVMDEIVAGYADLNGVNRQPLAADCDGPWVYSVAVGTSDLLYIVPVDVLVEQDLGPEFNPVSFKLTRWLPDLPAPAADSTMTDDGSSTGGNGGGSAGGAAR